MWSSKKNTIQVFFVLTEDKTDIANMSETMQLALQVRGDILCFCHLQINKIKYLIHKILNDIRVFSGNTI